MDNPEIVKIEINIAEIDIPLQVDLNDLPTIRQTETEIRNLYKSWKGKFPKKTKEELLAMMTYQYASHYIGLTKKYQEAAALAKECVSQLDQILGCSQNPTD